MKHLGVVVGMDMIERVDRVRDLADFFGFRLGRTQHLMGYNGVDSIVLYPKDNRMPTYSRDACLFTGSLSDVENFLDGIRWARQYDNMIGAITDRRRSQYEAREVARLEKILYNKAKTETFKILKDVDV